MKIISPIKDKIDRLDLIVTQLKKESENCQPNTIYLAMEVQRINENIRASDILNDQILSSKLDSLLKNSERFIGNYSKYCDCKKL